MAVPYAVGEAVAVDYEDERDLRRSHISDIVC